MTVRELLERTSSVELSEQMAYDLMRHQDAVEARQQAELSRTVAEGMASIKREVQR